MLMRKGKSTRMQGLLKAGRRMTVCSRKLTERTIFGKSGRHTRESNTGCSPFGTPAPKP